MPLHFPGPSGSIVVTHRLDARAVAARKRALAALQSPRALGTRGQRIWTREELHER